MEIIDISKKGSSVTITFEDNSSLAVRYEIFVKNMIAKGDHLSDSTIEELKKQNQIFLLKNKSFDLLSRRMHSEKELKDKLKRKGDYTTEIVEEVIVYLREKNYLNDEEFTRKFISQKSNLRKDGPRKIKSELIKKGINSEIIDREIISIYSQGDEYENAVNHANKKISSLEHKKLDKFKLKQKVMNYLANKGFSYDMIRKVVDSRIK